MNKKTKRALIGIGVLLLLVAILYVGVKEIIFSDYYSVFNKKIKQEQTQVLDEQTSQDKDTTTEADKEADMPAVEEDADQEPTFDNEEKEADHDQEKDDHAQAPSTDEQSTEQDEPVKESDGSLAKNHKPEASDYAYATEDVRKNMYLSDYDGPKLAFLTFDDGVTPGITADVLDILKEKQVPATFFIPGKNLENTNVHATFQRMYDEGHAIATHSYTHDYDLLYPGRRANADQIVKEHKMTVELMQSILGPDFNTDVFRYPGGHMSWNKKALESSDQALTSINVEWIDWNAMTGDAQPTKVSEGDIARPNNTSEVIANFDRSLYFTSNPDQVVVLMHDGYEKQITVDSLASLIDHLESLGYQFGVLY